MNDYYFDHFWVVEDLDGRWQVLGKGRTAEGTKVYGHVVAIFLVPFRKMAEKFADDLNKQMGK